MHTALIATHAVSATSALLLGIWALLAPRSRYRSVRAVLTLVAACLMTVALVLAVVVDAPRLAVAQRLVFAALAVLALVLVARSAAAVREVRAARPGWAARAVGHSGFVVVSLIDAFVVVTAVDLHLPVVVIALLAVAGVVPGLVLQRSALRRCAPGSVRAGAATP